MRALASPWRRQADTSSSFSTESLFKKPSQPNNVPSRLGKLLLRHKVILGFTIVLLLLAALMPVVVLKQGTSPAVRPVQDTHTA